MTDMPIPDKIPNRDQSLLKLIAILTMAVDHIGVVFFPGVLWLRLIGRIAFPLFCWGIVIGAERTRSLSVYALRLAVMAVVSQPFFMLALNHGLTEFNVMLTLLLGLLAIIGMKQKWYYSQVWAPILCLLLAASLRMDYGWRGVLLIMLMHLARNSKGGLAALMTAFCLYWGGGAVLPREFVFALSSTPISELNRGIAELLGLIRTQSLAILALPFMLVSTKSGLRIPKWLSYAAYPGHLAILWLLSLLMN